MSVVMSRRCEMCCNVQEHYDLVTCYNRGFQFSDNMMAKSHDLWLVGKLRSKPFKCIQAYVSIFSLSRDIYQTLDKSKTCQHFWKSLYKHLTKLHPSQVHHISSRGMKLATMCYLSAGPH